MPHPGSGRSTRTILVGSPRSGTTWCAKLIDSHPSVLYRHEPDSINVIPDIPFVPNGTAVESYLQAARDYLEVLFSECASKSAGSQPMFGKDYRGAAREQLRRSIIIGIKGGERVFQKHRRLAQLQIPDLIGGEETGPRLWFMKSVSSLCRTYMFSQADPTLRFLHIVRHPCAYVASTLRGKKLGLLSDDAYVETLAKMPESARYGWTLDVLKNMSHEEQLAARWMLQNDKVLDEMSGQSNYKLVVYEDLCADPRSVTADMMHFLGLEICEQSLRFIEESSASKVSDVRYFDVKRNSQTAAVGWHSELREETVGLIKELVAPSRVGALYR